MQFEFDPAKGHSNLKKHGVRFSHAEAALRDERTRIISARKASPNEVKTTMREESDFSTAKRGAVLQSPGKTRITIMLDDDVLEA